MFRREPLYYRQTLQGNATHANKHINAEQPPQAGQRIETVEAPILELLTRGEHRRATDALAACYLDPIYGFCLRRLRDRAVAQDVTQRVFVDAFRGITRYRGHATLRSWLIGIAKHRCQDERKAQQRRERRLDFESSTDVLNAIDQAPDPAARAEQRRHHEALDDCMRRLHERIRDAIDMRYTQDLSYEEISDVLGEKPGTLQKRVARAMAALRRCLEHKGFER